MTARSLIITLAILFGILQYKLWVSGNGLAQTLSLNKQIAAAVVSNHKLDERNQLLQTQVSELKQGRGTVESLAREEIGMIKPSEKYYQFVN